MKRTFALCLTAPALLCACGCAVGPDYKRPEVATPSAYREEAPQGDSFANLPWWDLFQDEQLRATIRIALADNQDLKIAVARIQQARASLGFTRADQWPSLGYAAQGVRAKTLSETPGVRGISFGEPIANDGVVAANVSFEVDLWGRLRRATESAREQLLATEEARRSVTLTLVSDVAATYLLLRDLDARLDISRQTLASYRENYRLIKLRYDAGWTQLLDVDQAQIQVSGAEAAVAQYERSVAQTETTLNLLLGRPPVPVPRGKALTEQGFPEKIPAGLPSDLLERRPDILQAEHLLHAQTAQIGVAQALRLPTFSLTGLYGRESQELLGYSGSATIWSGGLSIFGPLLDFGKSKSRVQVQRALAEQALQAYEKTALAAFKEVEDGLVAVRTLNDQYVATVRQVEAARSAVQLSQARYNEGYTNYLEVLDSERSLFSAEQQASSILEQKLAAVVTLYKALGGGWPPEPAPQSPPAAGGTRGEPVPAAATAGQSGP
ncbi:MAG: efflux transporter outer membrane subunit [Acidobacteriota bacterium]